MENDKSQKTIESYSKDVKQFLQWNVLEFEKVDKNTMKKYIEFLQEKGLAIKSINRKLVSINQFIKFLNSELDYEIKVKIKPLKIENQCFEDDDLENEHVRRMIRAAERENDVRAITIFYTLFYTGARVSEMLQIKSADIGKDYITIKGKGSKYRDLLLPKKLKEQLKKYTGVRTNTSEYLFTGERGVINRQTVHNTIKYYTGQARGINKNIAHAHAFRHLYSQNLAKLGVVPVVIGQLLGHSLNVTGLYIKNGRKDLLKIINKLDLNKE